MGCNTLCFQKRPELPFLAASRLKADDGISVPGKIHSDSMPCRSVWPTAPMTIGEAMNVQPVEVDATHFKAHRTVSRPRAKRGNDNQSVTNTKRRPLEYCKTAGHISDHTAVVALLGSAPAAKSIPRTGAMTPAGSEMR